MRNVLLPRQDDTGQNQDRTGGAGRRKAFAQQDHRRNQRKHWIQINVIDGSDIA